MEKLSARIEEGWFKAWAKASFDNIRAFTERAHSTGIRVNYLLNAFVLNHAEYTRKGRDEILSYVEQVAGCGVDMVTVAVPYLIELVRSEFPELSVCASAPTAATTTPSAPRAAIWGRHLRSNVCGRPTSG